MRIKEQQITILFDLLSNAKGTKYGRNHLFGEIKSYSGFCDQLPICLYEDIEDQVTLMKEGEADLLWPGKIDQFAVSAGTTGQGKHLPLTRERLHSDCRFIREVAFCYLKKWSRIPSVIGKHLSLPGSLETQGDISIGEISGFTALRAPWWLRPFHLIKPSELVELPFDKKFETVLNAALRSNIKVIIAVPSWILTLFQQALQRTGKKNVSEIWPNLSLLICGGVKLANYRSHLKKLYGNTNPDFIETYGSSEGYFAYSNDIEKDDLQLVYDNNIFYEFIPDPLPDIESLSIQPTVPLWKVETGIPYAMLVTTNAGLWRYAVNDIVRFSSVDPPRIEVMGRLSEMLDEFGEALYLYEAEQVLDKVISELNMDRCAFTVGGLMKTEQDLPRHYWFIQFPEPIHSQTLRRLGKKIDAHLKQVNRHYAIRRQSKALGPPQIHSITQQDINNWLDMRGKNRAQSKLPKLLTADEDIEFFL